MDFNTGNQTNKDVKKDTIAKEKNDVKEKGASENISSTGKTLELKNLKTKSAEKLVEVATEHGLENIGDFGRQDIIYHILKKLIYQVMSIIMN